MAVEGVIFDISDTLIGESTGAAVPGVLEALQRLQEMGVRVITASTHPHEVRRARAAGVPIDLAVTRADVGNRNKGDPIWIDHIKRETGLRTNQLIYVGDSAQDMRTAVNAHVFYVHAAWTGHQSPYGVPAPHPAWVPAVVQHIFRKQHPWWWTLDTKDRSARHVKAMAMIDPGERLEQQDRQVKDALMAVLKAEGSAAVGSMDMKEFVMLHLISSIYAEGLHEEIDWWTTYPGHLAGSTNNAMAGFLDLGAKMFRQKYKPGMFIRHKEALRSRDAYGPERDIDRAITNQLTTVHLDAANCAGLDGKSILVVDNFLTHGPTTEIGRNLLLAGGARAVTLVGVGKYGRWFHTIAVDASDPLGWDPFSDDAASAAYQVYRRAGNESAEAQAEFVASYQAMRTERW